MLLFIIGTFDPQYINDLEGMRVILDFDALPVNNGSFSHVTENEEESLLQFSISEVATAVFSNNENNNFYMSMSRRRILQTLNAVRIQSGSHNFDFFCPVF